MSIRSIVHSTPQLQARGACFILVSLLLFAATAGWTQWARADLDPVQATLSTYLIGPWGLALRAAYCILALAIMLLACLLYTGSRSPRRSGAAPLLFVLAALGLLGVAIGDSWLPEYAPSVATLVHTLSASMVFFCVTAAMLLQSWYLRVDPRWPRWANIDWWLAWLAFGSLCLHVLWRGPPPGAGQKLVISFVVAWMLVVAAQLWRQARWSTEARA
jgi:hypothetical protein